MDLSGGLPGNTALPIQPIPLFLQKNPMKKLIYFYTTVAAILFAILMSGFGGGDLKNSGGAPAGNTNSPGDGQNCTHCMGGTATAVTGWITSDVPVTGYLPGATYTITVTATGAGKKGFEVSPQTATGTLVGTLTAGTGNKLVGTGKYVTHNAAISTNPAVWTFQWTAPAGGAGDVTFYGAIAVTKTATKTTTLTISQSTVGMDEPVAKITNAWPNPCRERLNVTLKSSGHGRATLDIIDRNGRTVTSLLEEILAPGLSEHTFNIGLAPGLYFLRISENGETSLSRLIVTI